MSQEVSPADAAFQRFRALINDGSLASPSASEWSETDTRSKLIDPIFKSALDWLEIDIRRETPVAHGFVDYVLGADYPHLHIEAKRLSPRFRISAPSRARHLALSGPHLLGNKELVEEIEQAARYAAEIGSPVALLTNGDQFVIFRPYVPRRKWREGRAIVFHDLDDIREDFARFYSILSRERVRAGALVEALETAAGAALELHTPISSIHNPDAELVRNPYWGRISEIVGPLLTDDPQSATVQEEIIRHCYVRTPLADEANRAFDHLVRDTMPQFLRSADATDLRPGMHGVTAFDLAVEADVKGRKLGTYILTGGVGSGKTTFLKRFAGVVARRFVQEYCVWLHLDFIGIGSVAPHELESELTKYTFRKMRSLLEQHYPEVWPATGQRLRDLFQKEIAEAETTVLFDVPRDSEHWRIHVNQLVGRLFDDDQRLMSAVLRDAPRAGLRVVVVLDNTDQLGEKFQEAVFLLAQRLSREVGALAIVTLREEKFFAAYRRGLFDAFGNRRFHVGSPSLKDVIRKRLEFALRRIRASRLARDQKDDIELLLRTFIRSATEQNQNIVRYLQCVSNGDMRYALGTFREFVSSGNTDTRKILRIARTRGRYTIPFHEFAKSAILGVRRFYRSGVAETVNLFQRSAAATASHFASLRMLARLEASVRAPSSRGEGFVDTNLLLAEYRMAFGRADDFIQRGEELLRRGLVESEPPRAESIEATDALRITAAGAYYWRYLVRAFAYLDLVFVDTPLASKEVAASLAGMATVTDLSVRFERVRIFTHYLAECENAELTSVRDPDSFYRKALMPSITTQVEAEIDFIQARTGARNL